ncbi:hypothetical protein NUU61_004681 [Penicillium alfredii]|uniref:Heme-binding peroxidase n=1 Tax=Penicillium alfredii TaxID=1506179 RepID=A0A9W9K760_9EURO|nr:uncharacterized protein NUU61_004681 [Penicillium alfredii]KAJ5095325.1 hypothetical protein NUU61_004681 [Penicillium alfredii]
MAEVDLPSQIKATIKEPHSVVNRLNTARIPLCLPPSVKTPIYYTLGFARWAEIYLGLEEVWHSQIGDPADWTDLSDDPKAYASDQDRVQAVLRKICLPELLRTRRLEGDFAALKALDPTIANLDLAKENVGTQFRSYIKEHIPTKPHLLVAYIWIMYQALFNGGRFIRMQLLKAGPDFWGLTEKEMDPTAFPSPLSFWCVEEADVVQAEFRNRVVKADNLLTETERQEILQESLEIFRRCELITHQLDEDVAAGLKAAN